MAVLGDWPKVIDWVRHMLWLEHKIFLLIELQRFSNQNFFSSRGHLVVSGEIFDCHISGKLLACRELRLGMQFNNLQSKGQPHYRELSSTLWIVVRLRNTILNKYFSQHQCTWSIWEYCLNADSDLAGLVLPRDSSFVTNSQMLLLLQVLFYGPHHEYKDCGPVLEFGVCILGLSH